MADAGRRGLASTGSSESRLGAVRRRDGCADAECDLRLHRRIRQASASRVHARDRHAWYGATAAASAVRFHEAVCLQPVAARVRLLPLPQSQMRFSGPVLWPCFLQFHVSDGCVDELDWMDDAPGEAEACGGSGDLKGAARVAGRDDVGLERRYATRFPLAELLCRFRLNEIVNTGTAAADIRLRRREKLEAGNGVEQLAR